jgi:hypothetical protein
VKLPAWARISDWTSLELTVFAAFCFHFAMATFFPSLAWADEIFQTLEQGHRLVFGYGVVPWEFRDGVRSWVLPALLGVVMRGTSFLGSGSSGYLIGIRLFLSACSVVPVGIAVAWARREKLAYPWIAGAATAVWFELVYLSAKALTEVFAAYAVAAALYACIVAREDEKSRAAIWAGVLWGLAVALRVHLAPAALVAVVWTCRKDARLWKQLVPPAAAVVLAFGLVDWVTWKYPFQSYWSNFYVNMVEGKAATFGVAPPWEYLQSMAVVWGVGGLVLVALAGLGFKRWPLLGLVALTLLVEHSAIAHKEYRFLAPFFVLVVIAAGLTLARLVESKRALGLAACVAFIGASVDGARRFDFRDLPPKPHEGLPPFPIWTLRSGELRAYEYLSKEDSVCGIASAGCGWGWTGGYTYLHKNVPMFDIRTKTELKQYENSFNYLITIADNGSEIGPFKMQTCWGQLCMYRRDGPCESPGSYTINGWLADTGY